MCSSDPGPVSIKLYRLTSRLLLALIASGTIAESSSCTPGGIKGAPRILFKSMTKYRGDTSRCNDQARVTAAVDSLAAVVAVARAVFECTEIVVVRTKNRFDPEYDAVPIGGYRDFQLLCLVEDPATPGTWRYCELQINLHRMVQIKAGLDAAGSSPCWGPWADGRSSTSSSRWS